MKWLLHKNTAELWHYTRLAVVAIKIVAAPTNVQKGIIISKVVSHLKDKDTY
jgi:hypothetical protein